MFIVIEGIDGAGCETQAKRLLERLQKNPSTKATLVKYPDYERNVGRMIREFLYRNKDLTAEQQFLLYTTQFVMDTQMIREKRGSSPPLSTNHYPLTTNESPILIADRYFTTTLCYQTLEGIKMEMAIDFARNFRIEVPDLVFYLNVDPDTAIKRKGGEDKEKNRREKDFEFIRRTHKKYAELVRDQTWCKWVDIDGNRTVEEISKEIYNKIRNPNVK